MSLMSYCLMSENEGTFPTPNICLIDMECSVDPRNTKFNIKYSNESNVDNLFSPMK